MKGNRPMIELVVAIAGIFFAWILITLAIYFFA